MALNTNAAADRVCIGCAHWSLKDTDRSMASLGFARCLKKQLPGYTTSASAQACERFSAVNAGAAKERQEWLKKKDGGRA